MGPVTLSPELVAAIIGGGGLMGAIFTKIVDYAIARWGKEGDELSKFRGELLKLVSEQNAKIEELQNENNKLVNELAETKGRVTFLELENAHLRNSAIPKDKRGNRGLGGD